MAQSKAQSDSVDWQATSPWIAIGALSLILLVGVNLRTPLLAVPPLLAVIRADLRLSYSATGLLTSLPSLLMGLGAWPAGRIGGRIGARRSVTLGLALVTLGTIARSLWPTTLALYLFTATLSAGVALAQTSIPALARQWFPNRIGLVSAIYTDGLTLGETLGASATVPLMRVWFGANAWPAALLMWALPLTLTLLVWLWIAPPAPALARLTPLSQATATTRPTPATHSAGPWRLGAIIGGGSVVYFGMNGWVAPYNEALHANSMTPVALFALNAAQLPVCFALTFVAHRIEGRRWPFLISGGVALVAVTGWLVTTPSLEPLWGALIGGASAAVFTLGIALPAIYGHGAQVARLTGGSLAVSYTATFIGPYLGGVLWDTFHTPWLAFTPVLLAALALIVASTLLPRPPAHGPRDVRPALATLE